MVWILSTLYLHSCQYKALASNINNLLTAPAGKKQVDCAATSSNNGGTSGLTTQCLGVAYSSDNWYYYTEADQWTPTCGSNSITEPDDVNKYCRKGYPGTCSPGIPYWQLICWPTRITNFADCVFNEVSFSPPPSLAT